MKIISFKDTMIVFSVIQFNNVECGCSHKSCRDVHSNNVKSHKQSELPTKSIISKPVKIQIESNETEPIIMSEHIYLPNESTSVESVVDYFDLYVKERIRNLNGGNLPYINVSEDDGKIVLKYGKFTAKSIEEFYNLQTKNELICGNLFNITIESTKPGQYYNIKGEYSLGQIFDSLNIIGTTIREKREHYLAFDEKNIITSPIYIKLSSGKVYISYNYCEKEYLAIPSCKGGNEFKHVGGLFYRDGEYYYIDFNKNSIEVHNECKRNFDVVLNNEIEEHIAEFSFQLKKPTTDS